MSLGSSLSSFGDSVSSLARDVDQGIDNAVNTVNQTVDNTVGAVTDTVDDTFDTVSDTASNVGDALTPEWAEDDDGFKSPSTSSNTMGGGGNSASRTMEDGAVDTTKEKPENMSSKSGFFPRQSKGAIMYVLAAAIAYLVIMYT